MKPLIITSEGGREVKAELLTGKEVKERLLSASETPDKEWTPNDIYDTQLVDMTLRIDTPIIKLVMKAEREIERRLLLWVSWAGLVCIVMLCWV